MRPLAFLVALSGSVLNARALNEADQRNIVSRMTFVSATQNIGIEGKAIVTDVGNLEGVALHGSLWVENLRDLTVGDVNSSFHGVTAGTSGYIKASSPVIVTENSTAANDLEFWAETTTNSAMSATIRCATTSP